MSANPPAVHTDIYGKPVEKPEDNYLTHGKGILSWLLTLDHKRIGLMYMAAILGAFLLGGLFAMAVRIELLTPEAVFGSGAQSRDFYNHMFTLHGAVMVFMFIIPAIPAILGNFVLPLMVGAKDVAFPRLNLASWYIYMLGGAFFVWVLLSGVLESAGLLPSGWGFGLDTGWTFYTPYSTSVAVGSQGAVVAAVTGAFVLGFSSILTGLNFIATIHMLRVPGMTWYRLPLFLWALYATAVIQILATPVLAITLLLLAAERIMGVGIFDPNLGGDPVLYQHFFWFYSHPAVYIMILPAFGIISEIISSMSRKHIFGYKFIAYSSVAIALLGFVVWGHHMFVSGQGSAANVIFSLLTFSVAIPSAIKVFNWMATMYKGAIRLDTPMLYALGFIGLFLIGGLTGLFLGNIAVDIHVHDTYFVVAHFHFVMVGSTLFAFLGGMFFWWPKMFGRMYCEWAGRIGAVIVFIGFNATFIIQFIGGTQGMTRRYATYATQFHSYQFVSSIGAFILAFGLFWVLGVWIHSLLKGGPAPANPWGHNSLEWHINSPPPHENFDRMPHGSDPYHFDDWTYDEDLGSYILNEPQPAEGVSTPQPQH